MDLIFGELPVLGVLSAQSVGNCLISDNSIWTEAKLDEKSLENTIIWTYSLDFDIYIFIYIFLCIF